MVNISISASQGNKGGAWGRELYEIENLWSQLYWNIDIYIEEITLQRVLKNFCQLLQVHACGFHHAQAAISVQTTEPPLQGSGAPNGSRQLQSGTSSKTPQPLCGSDCWPRDGAQSSPCCHTWYTRQKTLKSENAFRKYLGKCSNMVTLLRAGNLISAISAVLMTVLADRSTQWILAAWLILIRLLRSEVGEVIRRSVALESTFNFWALPWIYLVCLYTSSSFQSSNFFLRSQDIFSFNFNLLLTCYWTKS